MSSSNEEKIALYAANPKICKWCGNIVPYERKLGNFCCEECARQHANERHRKHYWANKPVIQVKHAKYYQDHKEERIAHQREYEAKNPTRHRDYYYSHQEQQLQHKREHYASNIEMMRERNRRNYEIHKCGKSVCLGCGKPFIKTSVKQLLCSECRQRRHDHLYGNKTAYKGNKNGSVHRQVLRDAGILTPDLEFCAVHHMDGDRGHNVTDNMFLLPPSEHARLHRLIEKEWINHQDMTMEQLSEFVMMKYNLRYY